MVFRGNREGIDRQLTANEGGNTWFSGGNREGIDRQLTANEEGGNTWFSGGTEGVLTAN